MSQKNFTNATGNWIVSDTGEISYTGKVKIEGDLQANDFLDSNGNSIIVAGYLKSVDEYEAPRNVPLIDMVSWTTDDAYNSKSGVFNIRYEKKSFAPDYFVTLYGHYAQSSLGMGIHCESENGKATHFASPYGSTITVASDQAQFLTPEIALAGDYGYVSDEFAAVKLKKDGPSVFKHAVQAADFLDADGNSIVPERIVTYNVVSASPDHGAYTHSTDLNTASDQRRGKPLLQFSGAPTQSTAGLYVLGGASGESTQMLLSNNPDRNKPFQIDIDADGRSTAYLSGSTYRWELQAPQILLGAQGYGTTCEVIAEGTIQAADFLDADGNSIVVDNSHTDANNNVSVGEKALEDATLGPNTAMGVSSLGSLTTGKFNTAVGYASMSMATTGNNNTAVGHQSLQASEGGSENTGVGTKAVSNSRGNGNTGFGYYAGSYNSSGNYNTAVGHSADMTQRSLTNATAIGYNAKVNASNKIQLGNADVTKVHTHGTIQAADFLDSIGNPLPKSATVNNLVTLTQAQYDALSTKDLNTIYFIKE